MTEISYKAEIYRKLIHLSSLWMVVAIYFLTETRAVILFSFCVSCVLLFEILRRKSELVDSLVRKSFLNNIFRKHESAKSFSPSGAFFVVLAALLSVLFFSKVIAATAFLIMILGDTAAALIGRRYGKTKFFGKSLEGSMSFFIVSLFILSVSAFHGLPINILSIVFTALMATFLELFSKKLHLDDNLTIVIGVGAILTVLANL